MRFKKYRIFLFLILCCSGLELFAQTKIFSPYSGLGFGQISNMNTHYLRGSAISGAAFHKYNRINLVNPASLGFIHTAMFDVGFDASHTTLKEPGANTVGKWTGNINYMSIAFSIRNPINEAEQRIESDWSWGMGFNLKPYSTVGYDVQSSEADPDYGSIRRNYLGQGGTYVASWSNGLKYKNLAIGANVGFLFGSSAYTRYVSFPQLSNYFQSIFEDSYHYNGWVWDVGAMYEFVMSRVVKPDGSLGGVEKSITFGVTGNGNWQIDSEADKHYYRQHTFISWTDTLVSQVGKEYKTTLPSTFGIGVMYKVRNKMEVSLDYRKENWTLFDNPERQDLNPLKDGWKAKAGFTYTPDHNNLNNFFKRVTYFAGLYYEEDPRTVSTSDQLTDYGVSFGMALPFFTQRQLTIASFSFRIGKRGVDQGLTETYFNMGVGLTLTDNEWFIKRKYE